MGDSDYGMGEIHPYMGMFSAEQFSIVISEISRARPATALYPEDLTDFICGVFKNKVMFHHLFI